MAAALPPESLRLIESLKSPRVFGQGVLRVELLETHISWVLLTGEYAYKLKKPVDFGFVDFTTLKRRKFFCEEELRLNRRLAADLYLDVVAITGPREQPEIDGAGEVLDYAVKMREFPQESLLSHAIENGNLDAGHIDQLAEEIAKFHGGIAPCLSDEQSPGYGSRESILKAVWANFGALLEADIDPDGQLLAERPLPEELSSTKEPLVKLLEWARTNALRLAEVFERRRNAGAIRECHGDMHLGNMLLEDDEVVIFDGIEFNPGLRWIDVLSEVAFCMMDLADRHRTDFAYRLLNRYLEHTGDYAGLIVLPFYLSYRALVRAKVAHLEFQQHAARDADRRAELALRRRGYIDLALRLIEPKQPRFLITHGLSGSGKSFGTEALIEFLGAVRVRSDVERKRLAGLARAEKSPSNLDASLYSSASTEATYQHLAKCAEHIVAAGFPVVLDASFLKSGHRAIMRALADRLGAPFVILDFAASDDQLRERIAKRLQQGTDPSEASLEVLEQQFKTREPLSREEQQFAIRVTTENANFAEELLARVEER